MSAVRSIVVAPEDADLRLDRWFKRHFPELGHARLSRLLRTGQIRVDGGRAKAGLRLAAGNAIRIPPLGEAPRGGNAAPAARRERPAPAPAELEEARRWLIYRDDAILVLDKPAGLAVQGGSAVARHLDALLDGLRFGAAERPRLVHRLDRDTSGVLVLARSSAAARRLAELFRGREARKVYWALLAGLPQPYSGRIDAPLGKRAGAGGEKVAVSGPGEVGRRAVTYYRLIEAAGRRVSWLALYPETGRTHQLRVHCAAVLRTPILGDGKYGGASAFPALEGIERRLHLHAVAIELPDPSDPAGRRRLRFVAPPPRHFVRTCRLLGFDLAAGRDPLADAPA
jgi:23S rRNA pseudouridine955/2504/2580 synthase